MPSGASTPSLYPSSSSDAEQLDAKEQSTGVMCAKEHDITTACATRDLDALVRLATSTHGLVKDELRRAAWPILLGCSDDKQQTISPWYTLPAHRDEEQVAKDVNRAFVSYPKGNKQLDRRKEELSNVIVEVLRRYPALSYFQGYHDIVQVLYLVLGPESAPSAAIRLSLLRIRDYMLPSLDPAIRHLELLPVILKIEDRVLYNHIPKIQPHYALGATLTLFSHVIDAYSDITRLFDFFLAADTIIPVYFFASLLLARREQLLDIDKEEEDIFLCELGRLPEPFDLERRIEETVRLYERVPPEKLGLVWWKVSSASVLKSTRRPYDVAQFALPDAQKLLRRQENEVRIFRMYHRAVLTAKRAKLYGWRHRRSGVLCISIAVGLCAFWLGGPQGDHRLGDVFKRIMGLLV
ncbi:uncharacterized protein EI97DRAFT_172868 [Westerdykella ornata]|uniref:Rab-GAP TBC domain-containing protein n=1 Tax=Westerdykella ornata TaxID=318751 RepID=A0A6A6JSW5_WESOR|nr:uncharacterized protein EI97DRAFT_172868 [Westerdykella ornata]KAF2279334.1 hypothetical protein EI97DRAFT_172868 [Westerdykella ornata]